MRRGREQAELVKSCAAAHGVTERAVRKWRDQGDNRWAKFLAERAAAGSLPVGQAGLPPRSRTFKDEELTLDYQIRKLKERVADLGERVELARQSGDIDMELSLNRMYKENVEALRKLEKDAPDMQKAAGDVVSRRLMESALLQYAADVSAALTNLSDRIISILPPLEESFAAKVREEIVAVQVLAREVRVLES